MDRLQVTQNAKEISQNWNTQLYDAYSKEDWCSCDPV